MELTIDLMVEAARDIPMRLGFIGALIGGILGFASARSTNSSNQAIAQRETETNLTSAREANALTEKLANQATKSTEGMTASALALSKSQFDQSQAFNERMSNTAYTRGVKDLKSAGLNPILAATRGVTTTPSVSGGPTASGSGTGGSGTATRASQFRKVDAGLQALNSAVAVHRTEAEVDNIRATTKRTAAETAHVRTQDKLLKKTKGSVIGRNVESAKEIGSDIVNAIESNMPRLPKGSGRRLRKKLEAEVARWRKTLKRGKANLNYQGVPRRRRPRPAKAYNPYADPYKSRRRTK